MKLKSKVYGLEADLSAANVKLAQIARFEQQAGVCVERWAFDSSVEEFKAANGLVRVLGRENASRLSDVANELRRAAQAVETARDAFTAQAQPSADSRGSS